MRCGVGSETPAVPAGTGEMLSLSKVKAWEGTLSSHIKEVLQNPVGENSTRSSPVISYIPLQD